MLVTIQRENQVIYPPSCPLHCVRANGLGICGHDHFSGSVTLYCEYTNEPSHLVDPPSKCPLTKEPVDGIRIEMA